MCTLQKVSQHYLNTSQRLKGLKHKGMALLSSLCTANKSLSLQRASVNSYVPAASQSAMDRVKPLCLER